MCIVTESNKTTVFNKCIAEHGLEDIFCVEAAVTCLFHRRIVFCINEFASLKLELKCACLTNGPNLPP